MANCNTCDYHWKNDGTIPVRTQKGMMQPGKEYCEHTKVKHKLISNRAKGRFNYPAWCPLAETTTCIQCGTRIRKEEGEYCKNCL